MTSLIVYVCGPIDSWGGWRYLGGRRSEPSAVCCVASFVLAKAMTDAGWRGDGAWYCSGLPNPNSADSLPIFAVKQDHGGATFVASPVPLVHLEEDDEDGLTRHFANLPDVAWGALVAWVRPEVES